MKKDVFYVTDHMNIIIYCIARRYGLSEIKLKNRRLWIGAEKIL